MRPIVLDGNLIVVDKALWRDEGAKHRRKAKRGAPMGPEKGGAWLIPLWDGSDPA